MDSKAGLTYSITPSPSVTITHSALRSPTQASLRKA
jgi:hypothetical protein